MQYIFVPGYCGLSILKWFDDVVCDQIRSLIKKEKGRTAYDVVNLFIESIFFALVKVQTVDTRDFMLKLSANVINYVDKNGLCMARTYREL